MGLATLLALALSCKSGSSRDTGQNTGENADQGKGATATGQQPDKKPTGPRAGGHLRLPSAEPLYLNPVIQTQFDRATHLIFEGLVGLNERAEPVPRLASKWDLSTDSKTLTFTLRSGVKWHDDKPFTAKDVAFTYQAIRDTTASSLWKAYITDIESLETPDDHTVVVKYKQPYGPAPVAWTFGILPEHLYGQGDLLKSNYNREAVGSGPYKLVRWEPGQRMLLRANRDWWYKEADKPLPYIETIELLFGAENETVEALEKGSIDFLEILDVDQWATQAQTSEFREHFEVTDVAEPQFRAIAWNAKRKELSDKRVRQALTYAINRGRVIDDVMFRSAQAISGPFFPTMYGADPSIAPLPFDLDKAVKLLDEAGYPAKNNGPRFTIEVIALKSQEFPATHASIGMFRNDLSGIKVQLEMTFLDANQFFARILDGNYGAVYFHWLPDIADPDPYGLLHSEMIGAGSNYAFYSNPEVDRLLEQARATASRDERKTLYHQLHRILHEDMPYTPLYAPMAHYAWNRVLRGVNPSDISAQPRFPGIARWWMSNASAPPPPAPAKKPAP